MLLELLLAHAERVLSRGEIFDALWAGDGGSSENVVDVYIGYLRRKLAPPEAFGVELRTLRGRGFTLTRAGGDRRMGRTGLWATAFALIAGAGLAGEAQDRLFATGALDGVETGQTLVFAHEREGSAVVAPALPPIEDGRVEIALAPAEAGDGRVALVSMQAGARVRGMDPLPASAGNPLLMIFMESSVNSMAKATGGSPFYIRNRMREALRSQDVGAPAEVEIGGVAAEGTRYAFRPFEGDPNAAQMGPFADLEVSFVLSDAAPGGFAALETVSGAGPDGLPVLRETMTLVGVEEAE